MDLVNHIKVFINITDPLIPQLFIQCTSYLNVCRSRSMNKRVWSCEDHHFLLCHCNLHKFVIPEWLFLPIRVIEIITDCYTSSQFVSNHMQILGKPMIQRTWESLVLPSTLDNFAQIRRTHG